jgi:BCD family chlorophyll transporter-like MFS transporter
MSPAAGLGWLGIVRLGLVQTSLGAIVVLTTSTMNRILVIEQALPAMIPGFLVALHYVVQLSRPRLGHASDEYGRRTPWIIAGMAILAVGGVLAAVATAWAGDRPGAGLVCALIAFTLIGIGVGTSGTSLLALLARSVSADKRAAAGSLVWIMMIVGFVITAGVVGAVLDPYSGERLILITAAVAGIAFTVTVLAVAGIEPRASAPSAGHLVQRGPALPFQDALREVWRDGRARTFTVFVFVSMLAYSTQDLILEPFAGAVFAMTPGESTQLAGVQNAGVLGGMLLVALTGSLAHRFRPGAAAGLLRMWVVGGCAASAAALLGLTAAGLAGPPWPLAASVCLLGLANGAFAAAAIAMMMALAGTGSPGREGVRMGVWGAAQAMAFALGGLLGTALIDLLRALLPEAAPAYATVFAIEAAIFLAAARLARRIPEPGETGDAAAPAPLDPGPATLPGTGTHSRWRLTT